MRVLKEAYEKALSLLKGNRNALDQIAQFLIERETITGKEFMDILERVQAEEKKAAQLEEQAQAAVRQRAQELARQAEEQPQQSAEEAQQAAEKVQQTTQEAAETVSQETIGQSVQAADLSETEGPGTESDS